MTNTRTKREHDVEISLNNHAVLVEGPKTNGLAIKKDAIEQGVKIQLDFVLSLEIGDRRTKVIGDNEEITVHAYAKFIAVAPDDNS